MSDLVEPVVAVDVELQSPNALIELMLDRASCSCDVAGKAIVGGSENGPIVAWRRDFDAEGLGRRRRAERRSDVGARAPRSHGPTVGESRVCGKTCAVGEFRFPERFAKQ